jgi:hypothetical protein
VRDGEGDVEEGGVLMLSAYAASRLSFRGPVCSEVVVVVELEFVTVAVLHVGISGHIDH